jgi:hypothetical protein
MNATAPLTSVTGPPAIPSSAVGGTKRQRGSTNGCGRRGDLRVTAAPLADDVTVVWSGLARAGVVIGY